MRQHTWALQNNTKEVAYLHAWLCVGVVGWLEPQPFDTQFVEEGLQRTNKSPQTNVAINNDALNLQKHHDSLSIQTNA